MRNSAYVSKEWASLFLSSWNRAVQLWAEGDLFKPHIVGQSKHYTFGQRRDQAEYANVCVTWLIPNGVAEPHVVAEGG